MSARGHEVKCSGYDGDELHDLHAHTHSPGRSATRLVMGRLRNSPSAQVWRVPTM